MTAPATFRLSLLVLAYFAFVSLGLPDGLIGVGWPSIRSEFDVATEAVGVLLFAGTAGYLTSSVVAGFSVARLGVGWLLAGSTALASLALVGYALSPGLGLMIPCALLAGIGGGAIDSGLNAYAASRFGPRHINWLHAFFGLGVALGPLIMTAVLTAALSWRAGYGVVASAQLVLALAFVRDPPGLSLASEDHGDAQRDRSRVFAAGQPRLGPLKLDDVAKVRSAVSRHFLETTYVAVPKLGGSFRYRLGDFRRSSARRAERIRERDVVAPRD
jgi:MFS family permease